MDGRLAGQLVIFCLLFFVGLAPSFAYNEQAPRNAAPPLTKFALQARLNTPPPPKAQTRPATETQSPNTSHHSASSHGFTRFKVAALLPPQHMTLNGSDLLPWLSPRYQFHLQLKPSGPIEEGNSRLGAYPSLQLTPQSSLGFSFHHFSPRLNLERAGLQSSLHFRSDGVKLNFRPTAISTQLEFDVNITDDESRFDLTYRY